MVSFPQEGGCVCGDVRYVVREDPVTVYACHCTDCQKETGSGFYLAVVLRAGAFAFTRGELTTWRVELPDGRIKGSHFCERCKGNLGGLEGAGFVSIDGGTLDDTSWLRPAGHIWTRSAQPWIRLPEDALSFPEQPGEADYVELAKAWRGRPDAPEARS